MTLFSFVLLNTIIIVSLAGLTFVFFSRFRRIPEPSLSREQLPFVSVIVPARNEELKIGRCLESLAKQTYQRYEIIVVDDRSVDSTASIIQQIANRYPRINFIKGRETPNGWIGKCNALVQAVPHASGEWLLFTDADTCHTPDSLRYAVDYAITSGTDLVSFMPVQELGSFWERVVMPVLLGSFLVGDPFNTINDPEDDRAYAYGQYILVKREVYEAVGGHFAVKDQILDDIMLARTVKGQGYQLTAADGQPLYSVRMYQNLETLWYGWTKNAYALIECNPGYLAIILSLINVSILGPFLQTSLVLSAIASGEAPANLPWIVICIAIEFGMLAGWYQRTSRHYVGVNWYHFFLLPLGSLTVTALYLTSAYLIHSGNNVLWKGRRYRVNSHKTVEPLPEPLVFEPVIEKALAKVSSHEPIES
ncbi:MAG TPA: glycosyltransferase family 2 protein [Candidatus Obscuribacterales bacterium]